MNEMSEPKLQVLTFKGCPHIAGALELARQVVADLAPGSVIENIDVSDIAQARALAFGGSPTLRVNGVDVAGSVAPADADSPRSPSVASTPSSSDLSAWYCTPMRVWSLSRPERVC